MSKGEELARYLDRRGIRDPLVLEAVARVPRDRFVPPELRHLAWEDVPLPIGHGQTISQPFVVASMTEAARVRPGSRVLEVGTGSGYQAAILSAMGAEVHSVEIRPELSERAAKVLAELGLDEGVHLHVADGYEGWPEAAPYDAILVAAAPDHVPAPLVEQLGEDGRLVIPVGRFEQELLVVERTPDGERTRVLYPVRFVPLVRSPPR